MAPATLSPSRLLKLSEVIARNTRLLNGYLAATKSPQPSFAVDAPADGIVIAKDAPKRVELERARKQLVAATRELHDLSVGPRESVRTLAWDFNSNLSLHFIYKYRIATAFPPNSTITFSELASKTGAPLHDLKRLVRHAMVSSARLFCEPTKNTIAHTASSRLLATDPKLDAWAGMLSEEFWPSATKAVEAMRRWPGSQEPTHTGFQVDLGAEKPFFKILSADPARMKRFSVAMEDLSTGEGFEASHLATGYDWGRIARTADAAVEPALVVDVGGSLGFACAAIAQRWDGIRFVVQDVPHVVAAANAKQSLPAAVRDRIDFMAHDFFAEQPVRGADVYLIRWCMHNWSDQYALRILRGLVPALKKGARVVINDGVLPEPKPPGPSWRSGADAETREAEDDVDADWAEEKSMRTMDLVMLSALNAREREVDEWEALFKEADERFIWKGASRPDGCKMWIIEAEWAG
ncbi:hypothetical protein MBLNU459_g3369t1 [Dothideomycetes sp. NU459]